MKYSNAERYHKRRLIEVYLMNYKETKKALDEKRESILCGSGFSEVCIQSGGTSNPTLNKALQLYEIATSEEDRQTKAIEKALEALDEAQDEDFKKIVHMKYFDKKYTDYGIMNELHLSKSTYWSKHHKSINLIAQYLGWKA